MQKLKYLFLIPIIFLSCEEKPKCPNVNVIQIGLFEEQINEICAPCRSIPELIAQRSDVKIIRYRLGRNQQPYLLTFINPVLTEEEKHEFFSKIEINDPNDIEFLESRLSGDKFWLFQMSLDQAEKDRKLLEEQLEHQATMDLLMLMQKRRKTYDAYPMGGGMYRIQER